QSQGKRLRIAAIKKLGSAAIALPNFFIDRFIIIDCLEPALESVLVVGVNDQVAIRRLTTTHISKSSLLKTIFRKHHPERTFPLRCGGTHCSAVVLLPKTHGKS